MPNKCNDEAPSVMGVVHLGEPRPLARRKTTISFQPSALTYPSFTRQLCRRNSQQTPRQQADRRLFGRAFSRSSACAGPRGSLAKLHDFSQSAGGITWGDDCGRLLHLIGTARKPSILFFSVLSRICASHSSVFSPDHPSRSEQ